MTFVFVPNCNTVEQAIKTKTAELLRCICSLSLTVTLVLKSELQSIWDFLDQLCVKKICAILTGAGLSIMGNIVRHPLRLQKSGEIKESALTGREREN